VHPTRRQWRVICAITLMVCVGIAITAGNHSDRAAWHAGAIIVTAGILMLWRLSES